MDEELTSIGTVPTEDNENELFLEIQRGINPSWDNLTKSLYVYIELERRLDNLGSSQVSRIYKYMLDRLEIRNRIINGTKDYSWNEIEIDGEFYPVDLKADLDFFHSPASEGQIGTCNFGVNVEFYHNPNHTTKEVSEERKTKTNTLSTEAVSRALETIAYEYNLARVVERPTVRLQSKELQKIVEGGELTRETVGTQREIAITLTDDNIEDTRTDLVQIATYYPELLSKVEITNSGSSRTALQEMVNEIAAAHNIAATSPVAGPSFEIVISSDNPDDFDLDFTGIQDAIIPGTLIDSDRKGTKLTLRNTGSGSPQLPNINAHLGNIETLAIYGMDIANLDIRGTKVRRMELSGSRTVNISRVQGIENLFEISFNDVSMPEIDTYLSGPYTRSSNLFDIHFDSENFSGRHILQELWRENPGIRRIEINRSHVDNIDGLEEFRDNLCHLNLYGNDLSLPDMERINRFYKAYYEPIRRDLQVYLRENTGIKSQADAITTVSKETLDYVIDYISSSELNAAPYLQHNGIPNMGVIVSRLFELPDLPYYLKDARVMRETLNLKRNPIMIENISELDNTDFTEAHLQDATLLLTIPQLEHLLNSGKTIPQKIRLKIESAAELDLNTLSDLNIRATNNGIRLEEVSVFDKSKANGSTMISPYTIAQYAYIRETLDILTHDIDPSEPDIDKYLTIYMRLAKAIQYNHESAGSGRINRDRARYFAERINSCRNMLDGLYEGQCVCAGYADILRNALTMVGMEARLVGNPTHAWNQVLIDDGTGNKKWYNTDLTWDRKKGTDVNVNGSYNWILKGKRTFDGSHSNITTKNVENVENDDYPLTPEQLRRAQSRLIDIGRSRDPIDIPTDPIRVISLDQKKIQDEYQRRLDDMYAKFYGDKDYEREYNERAKRYKSHEIQRRAINGTIYRSVDNYPERLEDERFLLLDKYKETLERLTKYEAGDTSVYTGTPAEINQALERDRIYIRTRNYTFNQHEHTQRDLATLGKYGERMPYIPRQQGLLKNVGRVLLNTGILARNIVAPVYRGIGRFVAQPIHRLVVGNKDASPYRNNAYHRMVSRRDYFLDEARRRDEAETQARRNAAANPNKVKPVRHPIRNVLEARIKAITQAKKGNEAVLRAGAADIRRNIREQEGELGWVIGARRQVADLRRQINQLNQELAARPYASNRADVEAAIKNKQQLIQDVEKRLKQIKKVATNQTDAVSNDQHAVASKEVNTLRVTAIKGVIKGVTMAYVGPKIHDWLAKRAIKTKEVPTETRVQETTEYWVPTTYKTKNVPIYEDVLDTGKTMSDIMGRNSGKQVVGFYSVWGGERRAATYNLTGNERITAIFQQIGRGGKGFSDVHGLKAPTLTDGTFPKELLDSSGFLRQDISLDQLLEGLNISPTDVGALDGIYVSVGDRYWTSLGNLVQGMNRQVQTGTIPQTVIDVAGHMEKTTRWVTKAGTKMEEYVDPTIATATEIGANVAKGAIAVDTLHDVFENVRNTSTNQPQNKKKPRKYTHTDRDLGHVPTSRKEYKTRREENER